MDWGQSRRLISFEPARIRRLHPSFCVFSYIYLSLQSKLLLAFFWRFLIPTTQRGFRPGPFLSLSRSLSLSPPHFFSPQNKYPDDRLTGEDISNPLPTNKTQGILFFPSGFQHQSSSLWIKPFVLSLSHGELKQNCSRVVSAENVLEWGRRRHGLLTLLGARKH